MVLVDSHAHLDFADYSEDLEMVLQRASTAGVSKVLAVSCVDTENLGEDQISLAGRHSSRDPEILMSFGVHPHDASCWRPLIQERLADLCALDASVALGEIGLDFYYNHSPAQIQKEVFAEQLEMAGRLGLPVIIHSRDAEDETMEILERHAGGRGPVTKGVVHCFTGSMEMAGRILDLGFYLGFSGIITFKNSGEMREIAAQVPLERILVETDSPFLAPVPFRGKRNEPSWVVEVAKMVAAVKGIPLEEVASVTTANFSDLFRGRKSEGGND